MSLHLKVVGVGEMKKTIYSDYFIPLAALAAALDWDAYLTSDIGSTSLLNEQ